MLFPCVKKHEMQIPCVATNDKANSDDEDATHVLFMEWVFLKTDVDRNGVLCGRMNRNTHILLF